MASPSALRRLASTKLTYSNHASRSPRHNGSSKTIPCQQSSRTKSACARARPSRHPWRRIPRPRHATEAECCSSLCRIAGEVVYQLLVDKLSAILKPGPRAAPANKLRQGRHPKGAMYAHRHVAKSLNRDHNAPPPALAQDLCGRRPISINLSTSQLNEKVSWIDLRTMEPLLHRSNITGICSRKQRLKLGGKPRPERGSNEYIPRLLWLKTVVCDPRSRPCRRHDRAALARARGPAVRSISARAALHAWPRAKMAREAGARCKLIESSP